MAIQQKKLLKVALKTNGHCFYCNGEAHEVDHFLSKSKHIELDLGKLIDCDDIENLFLACKSCNISKSNKWAEDFIGNPFKAWSRYYRANYRIGIGGGKSENLASWGLAYK